MKIDPHVHTSGISLCSRINFSDMIDQKKLAGYDAVVLTNHCQPWYYQPQEHSGWIEKFLNEYYGAKEYGDKKGIKVFLGVEVSVAHPHWSDFLIYGTSEDFFTQSPCLYNLTQKELFDYCEKYGAIMVQAHPFREKHSPAHVECMHGVEINLRPQDFEKRSLVEDFANEHNLLVTCGSDYHSASMKEFGGMIIPDQTQNSVQMAKRLTETGESTLFFQNEVVNYKKR